MLKPSLSHLFALVWLLPACVRAVFSPIDPGIASGVGGAGGTVGDTISCPAPSVKACQAQSSVGATCDPVCQTGACDWCAKKCSLAGDGSSVCSAAGPLATGSACAVFLDGTPDRYDLCASGNICLTPDLGSGLSYCFALCRTAIDCPSGGACSERVLSASSDLPVSVKVCDPPYRSCNPSAPQRCCDPLGTVGCDAGQFCYLAPPDPVTRDDRTVCDYSTGAGGRTSPCNTSRDCMPEWTCFGASAGVTGVCRRVCDPKATNPCGVGGGACGSYGNQYGLCPG